MNLWIIFLTGLTVGGLTCLAIQGGLLASVIAAGEDEEIEQGINKKSTLIPTLAFLSAKFAAYTILGFLLGAFGGAIGISQSAQIVMQLVAGLYMIAIAMNLLEVHPLFRYAVIQPPRFLTKKVWHQSKSKQVFAPALLGAMTIFIPCGTTLAMEALAISSAHPVWGAAIMATFVLGTAPLFFGIGFITAKLGDNYRNKFLKVAAIAIIYLGLTSVNGALVAAGFPIHAQSILEGVQNTQKGVSSSDVVTSQAIEIFVTAGGYSPNYVRVKKGGPVHVRVIGKEVYSCASAFRVPSLGISKNLKANETYEFTFTPGKAGKIRFSCSMGMFTGIIEVI